MLLPRRLRMLSPLLLSLIISHVSAESPFLADSPAQPLLKQVLDYTPANIPNAHCTTLRLKGPIETTHCDYEAVDAVNENLFSKLHSLVETPFFRYFKVDLYRDCPFWVDDGLCMQRECGVTSLDETEVPERWRAAELSRVHKESPNEVRLPGCYSRDPDYCFLDDGDEGEYIDLAVNQEGYTGYAGQKAHRLWSAIYDENCFGIQEDHAVHEDEVSSLLGRSSQSPATSTMLGGIGPDSGRDSEECLEKRVYYRIISGLHASISTHICHLYLDKSTGTWGPNLDCFTERIADHPERLQYIYFNTVLLLRAVSRVGPFLSAWNLNGDGEPVTNKLLTDVVDIATGVGAFDETKLFAGSDAKILKAEFKERFRNVSRIMDCVGCDKCRLWGKVQVTGLAAAMKILFEMDEKALDPQLNKNLLSRWEVVALLNVLHRFTESLHAIEDFRRLYMEKKKKELAKAASTLSTSSRGSSGQAQPLPPHSYPATGSQSSASSSSPPSPSSNTSIPSSPITAQIQDIGRAVYDICKRSTIGCVDLLSRGARSVLGKLPINAQSEESGNGNRRDGKSGDL